ncbi:hypothetical protein ACFQX7_07270 [Luedemannella flava]
MHISYGFEIPRHELDQLPKETMLSVTMAVKKTHRVDCNPIFINRKNANEGECLKIGGDDVHWIHSEEMPKKATELFARTGRRLPDDMYFSGFGTYFIVTMRTLRQRLSPPGMLGRVVTVGQVASWSPIPLGALLGGWVTVTVGSAATVFIGLGILQAIIAGASLFSALGRADDYLSLTVREPVAAST